MVRCDVGCKGGAAAGDGTKDMSDTTGADTHRRERYVTAAELALMMGVSLRTVKRWTREGMPSETWGMRVRRYLVSECVTWARDRAKR